MNTQNNFAKKNRFQNGFTLIELLVVVALLMIVLSTSLFSYDRFGKDIELENSVYSLALATREAQVYGVNKKARDGINNPNDFGDEYGYGIYFTTNNEPLAGPKKFIIFIDKNNNKILDDDCSIEATTECYSIVSIQKGNFISNISFSDNGTTWTNSTESHITFKRPNPDARVINSSGTSFSRTRITVKDPSGISDPAGAFSRCIEIGVAGDISIKRVCN